MKFYITICFRLIKKLLAYFIKLILYLYDILNKLPCKINFDTGSDLPWNMHL